MIKFYQGTYSELSTKNRLESANNICFVTDRQVLIMGGKEYGKDSAGLKISVASGFVESTTNPGTFVVRSSNPSDFPSEGCAVGTLFFFKGDQSILKYEGGTSWSVVQNPELKSADLLSTTPLDSEGHTVFSVRGDNDYYQATTSDVALSHTTLQTKVADAYENDNTTITHDTATPTKLSANHVVVSKQNGIGKTDYVLDNGQIATEVLAAAEASGKSNALDTTLVNGRTAAKIVEEISKNKTTLAASVGAGSGFITWTSGQTVADGTLWTPEFHVLTGQASGALVNNNGTLETKFALRKLVEGDTGYDAGYRSQYALFNEAGGSTDATRVQIGDTINLVKDQFLKDSSYVIGWQNASQWYEYYTPSGSSDTKTAGWYLVGADGIMTDTEYTGSGAPAKDAANRYLKFIFALSNKSDNPDTTASDTDSVVYININELFDSYKGVNGVRVDQVTNTIYGVVDTNSETGMAAGNGGATKGVHFGANSYLTVGQGTTQLQDFKLDGIKKDISASIEDLDAGLTAGVNRWITSVGVHNGRLTADYTSAYTAGINFNGVTGNSTLLTGTGIEALNMSPGTWVTANDAISALALHIGNLDYKWDGTPGTVDNPGTVTKYIKYIEQVDGLVTVSGVQINGADLALSSKSAANLTATVFGNFGNNGIGATVTATEKGHPVFAIDEDPINRVSGSLQEAVDEIVTSVASTFASLDMPRVGIVAGNGNFGGDASKVVPSAAQMSSQYEPYKVVNTVVQSDGYVSATDLQLVAQTVGFEPLTANAADPASLNNGNGTRVASTTAGAYIPVSGYTVGAALSSISNYIGSLDFTTDTAGTAPASGDNTKYSIVTTVKQEQGQVSDTKIDLTDTNTFFTAINGKLPTTAAPMVNPGEAQVAVLTTPDAEEGRTQAILGGTGSNGTVQDALKNISNILADYLSFHNANGSVI